MSGVFLSSMVTWWATDTPVLPSAARMQWALQLSWSVVLAGLGATLVSRWTGRRAEQAGVAGALAACAWLPGQISVSYWLGLAFQVPSVSTVLLCGMLLYGRWLPDCQSGTPSAPPAAGPNRAMGMTPDGALAALGVALGWALLLDAFAVLPLQLYAWGFSAAAPVLVLLLGALPWLLAGRTPGSGRGTGLLALAVLLFVLLRLPNGNLWDAVLDPWLWLGLHMEVGRRLYRCYQ